MGGQHGIGGTYHEPVVIPVADYHVTGELIPNATGNYFYDGEYAGHPTYKKADNSFFIWWSNYMGGRWAITPEKYVTNPEIGYWYSSSEDPPPLITDGYYTMEPYSGEPFVTAGPA